MLSATPSTAPPSRAATRLALLGARTYPSAPTTSTATDRDCQNALGPGISSKLAVSRNARRLSTAKLDSVQSHHQLRHRAFKGANDGRSKRASSSVPSEGTQIRQKVGSSGPRRPERANTGSQPRYVYDHRGKLFSQAASSPPSSSRVKAIGSGAPHMASAHRRRNRKSRCAAASRRRTAPAITMEATNPTNGSAAASASRHEPVSKEKSRAPSAAMSHLFLSRRCAWRIAPGRSRSSRRLSPISENAPRRAASRTVRLNTAHSSCPYSIRYARGYRRNRRA